MCYTSIKTLSSKTFIVVSKYIDRSQYIDSSVKQVEEVLFHIVTN